MVPDRRNQISDLYHAALARPAAERTAFLLDACGGDEVLRQDIESLLGYELASLRFLETPAAEAIAGAVGRAPDRPEMVGRQFGPYTFVAPLGAGGMGDVYRARDSRLGRDVAIKILPSAFTSDSERRSRFAREARLLATLNHPHIGAIYGLEETDGIMGLVLELVEGPTLADHLSRGPLPVSGALAIARQLAEALDAAHEKGIVHRDLKPANIVLQGATNAGFPSGKARAKVLDFGLAKTIAVGLEGDLTQRPSGSVNGTAAGRILGTPAYMSPEQTRGQEVDKRTDIWAFGCVLYEMLCGRRAFDGDTISDTFVSILERDPDWTALPAATPASIRTLLERCLRKDARKRLHDIADALIAVDDGITPIASTRPTADVAPGGGRSGRERLGAMVAAAAALALVAAIATGVRWYRPEGQRPPTPATLSSTPVDRRLSRLTFDAGMQTDVTFSPDSRSIAYASDRAGNFDIWVQSVDGGEAKQITSSPARETQPAWSPDGTRIVFRTERERGGLSIVPAQGGAERELTAFGIQPVWSPDGTEIFFRTAISTNQQTGVFTVSPEGGAPPRALLSDIVRGGYWKLIALHPDGRISMLGGNPNLKPPMKYGFHTVSRDGRGGVTSTAAQDLPLRFLDVARFQWNSAATALYVEAIRQGVRNVWRVRVDPATLEWVAAERLTTGSGPDAGIALSSSGTRMAFTTEQRWSRLWTFPLNAAGRVAGKGTPFTPEDGRADNAALSPDGRFVAYHLVRTGRGQDELMLTDLDSNKTEPFAVDAWSVAWSPDSQRLAYAHRRLPDSLPPREWELVVRELGGPERVIRPRSATSVLMPSDWTPDGQFILGSLVSPLARATVPAKLALWPTSPSAAQVDRLALEDGQGGLWQARLSPNGHWLAFVQGKERPDDALRVELYVARPHSPPGEWTRIAPHHPWADKPRWSPDGRMLYFISNEGSSSFNLWAIKFDSAQGMPIGEPFKLTSFTSPDLLMAPEVGVGAEIGISARRAILTLEAVRGSIWLLEDVDR